MEPLPAVPASPAPWTPTATGRTRLGAVTASAVSAAASYQDPQVGSVFSPSFDAAAAGAGPELNRRLRGFNTQVSSAIDGLTERTEIISAKVVTLETEQRSLSDASRSVIGQMITEARTQFEALKGAAALQQTAILQEAGDVRQAFGETRAAIEELYGRAAQEFAGVRAWSTQAEQAVNSLGGGLGRTAARHGRDALRPPGTATAPRLLDLSGAGPAGGRVPPAGRSQTLDSHRSLVGPRPMGQQSAALR